MLRLKPESRAIAVYGPVNSSKENNMQSPKISKSAAKRINALTRYILKIQDEERRLRIQEALRVVFG